MHYILISACYVQNAVQTFYTVIHNYRTPLLKLV